MARPYSKRLPPESPPPKGLPIPANDLPERLLVISASARMLAESATRARIRVVALDHYADADTCAMTEQALAIPMDNGCFQSEPLLAAAARLAPAPSHPLVYGSGLDSQPELLGRLAEDREVLGNPPGILDQFRAPRRFFQLLDSCSIAYPEIRFRRPENPEYWLIKSGCSEGGKRVRFCAQDCPGFGEYYQRWISGPACSVLFLADGEEASILGFNTLMSSETPGCFLFEGANNWSPLTPAQRRRMAANIGRLVRLTGLKGLNSLDFMVNADGEPLTIEVNTRPSATLALYDEDYPEGLLAAHLRACRGRLTRPARTRAFRAFRVAYAGLTMQVKPGFRWPIWCCDRPPAESVIEAGNPLCTLRAEGANPAAASSRLEARASFIQRLTRQWAAGA
ncbi:MAG: ATP-grasp domain-containing protein [Methylococcus sp.]